MVLGAFRVEKDRPGSTHPERRIDERDHLLEGPRAEIKTDLTDDYSRHNIFDITRARCGWLVTFCLGLLMSALIVQRFEDLLEHHVQLSFFVPLIMGHGGNTGSQTVSTIIRSLALRQIGQRDLLRTVGKEALAGALMGGLLGALILLLSLMWPHLGPGVGLTVGVALPIISMWANAVGAFLTLLADRFKMDPAVTSVPLMTTIVDATGLIIYFYIAELFLDVSLQADSAHAAAAAATSGQASPSATVTATVVATAAAANAGAAKEAGRLFTDAVKKLLSPPPAKTGRASGGSKGRRALGLGWLVGALAPGRP
ncbi:hypothetical protein VOLCADRAFT_103041 [Volvox carteri f. nagariensis]|uniref:SLC41A/MgtE integral membrane domain-containing protein n=1 Tax=Volvox carteri f. nagariensis TaxID=3068 RepID=D8TJJ5_VOLCA|nr:uncharacterized protein VOLCADRAFT_103041 [Volvox carteri f. nagariensis]EFJ52383.1 hypothetical protein VOLCADRAFT_103041 [Volvox carteri f. nagariensis]|eukprot:XP_002946456.1 hypothetical protein VOLCADRAFT_103041 [Volvox carteri f. nagariensis]